MRSHQLSILVAGGGGGGAGQACDSGGLVAAVPQVLLSVHVRVCGVPVVHGLGDQPVHVQASTHAVGAQTRLSDGLPLVEPQALVSVQVRVCVPVVHGSGDQPVQDQAGVHTAPASSAPMSGADPPNPSLMPGMYMPLSILPELARRRKSPFAGSVYPGAQKPPFASNPWVRNAVMVA